MGLDVNFTAKRVSSAASVLFSFLASHDRKILISTIRLDDLQIVVRGKRDPHHEHTLTIEFSRGRWSRVRLERLRDKILLTLVRYQFIYPSKVNNFRSPSHFSDLSGKVSSRLVLLNHHHMLSL